MGSSGEIQENIVNSSSQTTKCKGFLPNWFVTHGWIFYRTKLNILRRLYVFSEISVFSLAAYESMAKKNI